MHLKLCLFNVTSTMDVIGSGEVGGVEAYTFRLGEQLAQRGHEVLLFGGKPNEGKSHSSTKVPLRLAPYIETSSIPHFGTRFRRLVQRLHFASAAREDFLSEKFDAVFIFKPYDFVTAWRWRRAGVRSRIIASIHGPEFYLADWKFSESVDAMFAVSESTARAVRTRYARACPVIPNFIDVEHYPWMERLTAPETPLLLTVGRLVGWKGIGVLLKAFAKLQVRHPTARLTVVGDGPERCLLQQSAKALGVGETVNFPGILNEAALAEYRRKAWIFVQPSVGYESFSISALEAMASGVRTVVSDQVGIADWFRDSSSLEIVKAGDEAALAEKLEALLQLPWSQHHEQSRAARKVVERYFDAGKVVSEIESLCR